MAWCRQATSHYLSQCWPRSLSPFGVTRPQWVKPSYCNTFEDWVLADLIYGYPICKWVTHVLIIWQGTRILDLTMVTRQHALLWPFLLQNVWKSFIIYIWWVILYLHVKMTYQSLNIPRFYLSCLYVCFWCLFSFVGSLNKFSISLGIIF